MTVFVISYEEALSEQAEELRGPRAVLNRQLSEWGGVAHICVGSVWIVSAEGTSDQIRDRLTHLVAGAGKLVVVSVGQDAAWSGLGRDESEWLLEHL